MKDLSERDLQYRKITKKHCRLSDKQKDELRVFLSQWPEHFGYTGDVWTLPRVGELILRKLGIKYCLTSVSGILKKIGWTSQKPAVRAAQRNEEARGKWLHEKWLEIKKLLKKNGQ